MDGCNQDFLHILSHLQSWLVAKARGVRKIQDILQVCKVLFPPCPVCSAESSSLGPRAEREEQNSSGKGRKKVINPWENLSSSVECALLEQGRPCRAAAEDEQSLGAGGSLGWEQIICEMPGNLLLEQAQSLIIILKAQSSSRHTPGSLKDLSRLKG